MSDTESAQPNTDLIQALRTELDKHPLPAKPTEQTASLLVERIREVIDAAYRADNADYRAKLRDANRRLEDYQKRLPEGAVVLSPEEATVWEAVKALGSPEELTAKLTRSAELERTIADRDAEQARQDAARSLGWNPKVLQGALKADGLTLAAVETDGVVSWQVVQDGGEKRDLASYAAEQWADTYLPALPVNGKPDTQTIPTGVTTVTTPPAPAKAAKPAPVTRSGVKPPDAVTARIDQLAAERARMPGYRL